MYASRTGTRRNLGALRAAGWRLMVSARGVLRTEGFPYALDNGAWTAHQQSEPFNVSAFERAVALLGASADFVVCPDKVADAETTRALIVEWLPRLAHLPRVLLAVQDGMTPDEVAPLLSERTGIFIGGTSKWKECTAAQWGALARKHGAWCHMGRVNSQRRIAICHEAGIDSCDGTSATRFSKTCRRLTLAAQQPGFVWEA